MELSESDVYVTEAEGTASVCARIIGKYNYVAENITVTLSFKDSLLAGDYIILKVQE